MSTRLVEARCPKPKCSMTHQVLSRNGEIIDTAYCPPSAKHRNWVPMSPNALGSSQVQARRAIIVEVKNG